jgi:hypothetical protein
VFTKNIGADSIKPPLRGLDYKKLFCKDVGRENSPKASNRRKGF